MNVLFILLKVFPCQPLRRQIIAEGWMGPFAAEATSHKDKPGALLELQCLGGML